MDVFFSWSGMRSKKAARAFYDFISTVFTGVDVWMSDIDIQKGSRFLDEIAKKLEKCDVGVVFLTPENVNSPWVNFEAGALSKQAAASRAYTILFELTPRDLRESPLSQFQHTVYVREDILQFVESLNTHLGPLGFAHDKLERQFNAHWNSLRRSVDRALTMKPAGSKRTTPAARLPKLTGLVPGRTTPRFDEKEQLKHVCNEVSKQFQFGVIPATGVGRAIHLLEQNERALQVFDYMLEKAHPLCYENYIIYANIGYCLNAMALYPEALKYLTHVKRIVKPTDYFSWLALALAYAHFQVGEVLEFERELEYAKMRPEYPMEVAFSSQVYPEIAHLL